VSEPVFPVPAERVIATVAKLFRLQGQPDLAAVVTSADARIEAVGSDFGVTYYSLILDVPVTLFATIEPKLSAIEGGIEAKLQSVIRYANHVLSKVVVSPILEEPMSSVGRPEVGEADALRLWEPQTFRLFLSHVSVHKVAVANLKSYLRILGVSAFVAHEDIEPTLEWQAEIDFALRSMHAMAALLTPEFHASNWTDQEVGVAVARGAMIVPVRLGLNPYGFIARQQALTGDLAKPGELAPAIVAVLARPATTGQPMREALVVALEGATSFAAAKAVASVIEASQGFTPDQLRRIGMSIQANSQVAGSFYARDRLRRYVASHVAPVGADK
jgi:TIR domain